VADPLDRETARPLPTLGSVEPLYEQAQAGHRRVLGDDDPGTFTSMNNLAKVRHLLGQP
jgi:hypothetical protein